MSENCRFCLKNLGFNDKFHEIGDEIKSDFNDLTNHELIISDRHMNIVCELCLRSLQLASTLKKQLIENQENFFKEYEYEPYEYEKSTINFVKVSDEEIKQENPLDIVIIEDSPDAQMTKNVLDYNDREEDLTTPAQLNEHKTNSTVKLFSKIICGICKKGFLNLERLNQHMSCHDNPKFRCDICNQYFIDKPNLHQHMRTKHLNEKDYFCPYCPKAYLQKGSVKTHILSMHKKLNFICGVPSCLTSFNYKHHCKRHIEKKHRDIKPEQIKDFIIRSSAISSSNKEDNHFLK